MTVDFSGSANMDMPGLIGQGLANYDYLEDQQEEVSRRGKLLARGRHRLLWDSVLAQGYGSEGERAKKTAAEAWNSRLLVSISRLRNLAF